LIFLETTKEKSLGILGKVWKSLEFPWKSLEILGKARGCGDGTLDPSMGGRPLASKTLAARRGGGKSPRKPLKANRRAGKRRRPRPVRPSRPPPPSPQALLPRRDHLIGGASRQFREMVELGLEGADA
jgi:hypothetical protein